jgi:integrase/recombinase XerD
MKKLILQNPTYEYLEKGFEEWLDILGYCQMGVYNMPHCIREFLHYLEQQQVKNIKDLTQKNIRSYYDYICTRPNQRRGGGLSDKYVQMHIQAIEKFLEYLRHKGVQAMSTTGIRLSAPQRKEITVLTLPEIKQLFELTEKESADSKAEPMNARDKAMLVVYYSCGLRRTEGVNVSIEDINLETRVLHVRKGKNYKQRFVPLNKTNAKYLEEYMYDHRPHLLKGGKQSALFISTFGRPMTGGTLYTRLKLLQQQSDDIVLQQKVIGLHTLRHSIATHLLQAGMSLEKIARFLGHSTMDSTQIYTHLAEHDTPVTNY